MRPRAPRHSAPAQVASPRLRHVASLRLRRVAGHRLRRIGRSGAVAVLVLALAIAAGCSETSPPPAITALDPQFQPDRQNFSELGISLQLPRVVRVAARSPEEHDLRLLGRAGDYQSLNGRMALITREGRELAMREAMNAVVATWNAVLAAEHLSEDPAAQPQTVANFHEADAEGLTIVKLRMTAKKTLPTERTPAMLDGEFNAVQFVATAYFVVVAPAPRVAGRRRERGDNQEKYLVALFVFEDTGAAEAMVDDLVRSIRMAQ